MTFETYSLVLTLCAILGGFVSFFILIMVLTFTFDRGTSPRSKFQLVSLAIIAAVLEYQFIRGASVADDLNRVYGSGASFETIDDLSDFNERLEILRQQDELNRETKGSAND